MRKHFAAIVASLFAVTANAQPVSYPIADTPSWVKLANFSSACDPIQVAQLLKNDPKLDLYTYSGLTAIQVAQLRYVAAIKNNEAQYIDACLSTVMTLMKDPRYKWKEDIVGKMTDLMYFLDAAKDLTPVQVRGLNLGGYLETLRKFSDFDISYQTLGATGLDRPRTVAGVIAQGGNTEIWCRISRLDSTLGDRMDERPNTQQYTPLLLAAAAGKGDMVRLLIAEGADWLVPLQSLNDSWPVEALAKNSSDATLAPWLREHKASVVRISGCTK
jgi:hypothetical protein